MNIEMAHLLPLFSQLTEGLGQNAQCFINIWLIKLLQRMETDTIEFSLG